MKKGIIEEINEAINVELKDIDMKKLNKILSEKKREFGGLKQIIIDSYLLTDDL